jgi:hypothetical protein
MIYEKQEHYSLIFPRENEFRVSCLFDIDYSLRDDDSINEVINGILGYKNRNYYIFWGFDVPEKYRIIACKNGMDENKGNESIPMALWKSNFSYSEGSKGIIEVEEINSEAKFKEWAGFNNMHLFDDSMVLHPKYHYYLCEEKKLMCYVGRLKGKAATVFSVLKNIGTWSLEFVATHEDFRKMGYAKALNSVVLDSFFEGYNESLITLRSTQEGERLYRALGFVEY